MPFTRFCPPACGPGGERVAAGPVAGTPPRGGLGAAPSGLEPVPGAVPPRGQAHSAAWVMAGGWAQGRCHMPWPLVGRRQGKLAPCVAELPALGLSETRFSCLGAPPAPGKPRQGSIPSAGQRAGRGLSPSELRALGHSGWSGLSHGPGQSHQGEAWNYVRPLGETNDRPLRS